MPIQPLDEIPISPLIRSLPKADLHLHQEERARLDRVVALRRGRPPFDWRPSVRRLLDEVPPGMERLAEMYAPDATLDLDGVIGEEPEYIVAKIADALKEGASGGAVLVEIRFGLAGMALTRPDFMELFREAERQVQARYPQFHAEAIGFVLLPDNAVHLQRAEEQFERCVKMAREGLSGVDFIVSPYHVEADPALWQITYQWAARASDAGLGITVHAGEFSAANFDATLRVPGLRRIGHGVYATSDQRILEELAHKQITVECCLSCNVILGAVPSYGEHPIRQLVEAGVPVTLNTDNPVRIWTTIDREYAIAAEMGFGDRELLAFTRNAIAASFTSETRRAVLFEKIQQWEATHLHIETRA